MTQDTRKDKRAKVVSLNVRYKSATVDEFIENHSHDVSKGGIFVKTPTPFPAGTLLKFEIRLAGDKSVIAGVGRVVWKREPTQATGEKPAGMGVKFIKLDDSSRGVIDKLVAQKSDAGSAYTSDPAALVEDDSKPSAAPTTLRGLVAATPSVAPAGSGPSISPSISVPPPSKAPPVAKEVPFGTKTIVQGSNNMNAPPPKPGVAAAAGATGARPGPAANRPATALGIGPGFGSASAAPPAAKSEPRVGAAAAAGGAAQPPKPNPRKQTMMGVGLPAAASAPGAGKHELPTLNHDISPVDLAGGAPFGSDEPTRAAPSPMFPAVDKSQPIESVSDPTMMKQAAELLEEALREAGGSLDEIGQNPLFSQSSQRGGKVEERKPVGSVTAPMTSLAPAAKEPPKDALKDPKKEPKKETSSAAVPAARAVSASPPAKAEPAKPLISSIAHDEKKTSWGIIIGGVFALALAVGGGVFLYAKANANANATTPATTETLTPPAVPSATETASAAASASASASAPPAVSASAAPSASAVAPAAEPSASASAPVPIPTAKPVAAPVVRPVAAPKPARPPMPAPTATDPDLQPAPPKETTPKDPTPSDEKPKETAPKETAPKETAPEAPAPKPTETAPEN